MDIVAADVHARWRILVDWKFVVFPEEAQDKSSGGVIYISKEDLLQFVKTGFWDFSIEYDKDWFPLFIWKLLHRKLKNLPVCSEEENLDLSGCGFRVFSKRGEHYYLSVSFLCSLLSHIANEFSEYFASFEGPNEYFKFVAPFFVNRSREVCELMSLKDVTDIVGEVVGPQAMNDFEFISGKTAWENSNFQSSEIQVLVRKHYPHFGEDSARG